MARNARAALIAIAAFAISVVLPAVADAAPDPLNLFRKYIEGPLERAARLIQPPGSIKSPKKKAKAAAPPKVALVAVPIPRVRPILEANATAVATWEPPAAAAGVEWQIEAPAVASVPMVELPEPTVTPASPTLAVVMPRLRPATPVRVASLPKKDEAAQLPSIALAALGVSSVPLPPIADGDCGLHHPVSVASLANGDVRLTDNATLNQRMAESVALWVRDRAAPTARAVFREELTGLRVAASYDCRTRSHVAGAELSEHAFGNAIDISAFRIGKRWIEVGAPDASPDDLTFLATIRKSACGPFTTVLGPGVAAHNEHFHLDLAKRGRSGRSLYCR